MTTSEQLQQWRELADNATPTNEQLMRLVSGRSLGSLGTEILRLRGEVQRLRQTVDRVRELHREQRCEWWEDDFTETPTFGPSECAHDYCKWPCPTIQALEGDDQ